MQRHMATYVTVALLAAGGFLQSPVYGTLIYEHQGLNNPLGEGWVKLGPGTGVGVGPVTDDQGTGLDAWTIDDSSTASSSWSYYSQSPPASQVLLGELQGWRASANLRLVDIDDPVDSGVFFIYYDGANAWWLNFGTDADGDPVVESSDGQRYTAEDAGNLDYHLYEMVFDPVSLTADVLVDGVERISDYAGTPRTVGPEFAFGSASGPATGQANWNLITLEMLPEPSAVMLILVGLMAVTHRRKRR